MFTANQKQLSKFVLLLAASFRKKLVCFQFLFMQTGISISRFRHHITPRNYTKPVFSYRKRVLQKLNQDILASSPKCYSGSCKEQCSLCVYKPLFLLASSAAVESDKK